jgi:ubiquinone/menaquinone biosynthesis C-methylase UbiE
MTRRHPLSVREHNRLAWDKQVDWGNPWTIPVSHEEIQAARQGEWIIYLTPTKSVPREWLPEIKGKDVLCLASGGGQQGPILAAAGARVTVLDNSPNQLAQDRMVAEQEGLELVTIEGDMADLSMFADESFDYIEHPVSNVFVPNVLRVWREAYRVLRRGGVLVAGFDNPVIHIFDEEAITQSGQLIVKYKLPTSEVENLSEAEKQAYMDRGEPFEFSHTLEEQIGGQTAAGFYITGLYEDTERDPQNDRISRFMPSYIATRAVKP